MLLDLICSIVVYKTDISDLKNAIDSLLDTSLSVKLYLIDNSPENSLGSIVKDDRVEYIFNGANLGFGSAHNIAIEKSLRQAKYHLILNPDIEFEKGVLEKVFDFMENNSQIGQVLPKVLYKDGSIQKLCKLLPTPYDLIGRRFFKKKKWALERNSQYELDAFSYNYPLNVPNLSGCFMFIRNSVLNKTGGFDKRYFMYLEDTDLTRRIHAVSETVYFPDVHIYHGYAKGSYSNPQLLKYHISSAIKYFTKWGWFIDKERDRFNRDLLKRLKD
jgi:GT2 family glycosyltransferase